MKAMKSSVIAKGPRGKGAVWRKTKVKTAAGVTKADLKKNKQGRLVTEKAHRAGKKAEKRVSKWTQAVMRAKVVLGFSKPGQKKEFIPIGGKTAKGKILLTTARLQYAKDPYPKKK